MHSSIRQTLSSEFLPHLILQTTSGESPIVAIWQAVPAKSSEKKSEGAPPLPPPLAMPGRKMTNTVILNPAEIQTLGEEIAQLTKALAGCDPQVEARISIKSKPDKNLSKANEILEKIKQKWRF